MLHNRSAHPPDSPEASTRSLNSEWPPLYAVLAMIVWCEPLEICVLQPAVTEMADATSRVSKTAKPTGLRRDVVIYPAGRAQACKVAICFHCRPFCSLRPAWQGTGQRSAKGHKETAADVCGR